MSWRETQFEDLYRIVLPNDPPEDDMRSVLTDTEATRDILREHARTWEDDGRIVAIVGVSPMWKGVGQVWTMLTEESRERGVALTRGVLRFLSMLHEERGYWRLQATVEHGDEAGASWIIQLGFGYEGTMIGYGPTMKAHDLYSRVVF